MSLAPGKQEQRQPLADSWGLWRSSSGRSAVGIKLHSRWIVSSISIAFLLQTVPSGQSERNMRNPFPFLGKLR